MRKLPTAFASAVIVIIALLAASGSALAQSYVYRPTAFTQPFVSTINSQSAAQAYLGISGGNPATNLTVYSSGTTNRPLRVYGTNGTSELYVDEYGRLVAPDGSASVPSLGFAGANNSGLFNAGFGQLGITIAGSPIVGFDSAGFNAWGGVLTWGTGFGGTKDSGISRNAAGVLEFNNGIAGNFRDAVGRSLFATNLYATNLVIGGGSAVTKILSATATLNFDLTAVTVEDLTMTVTGAAAGDSVDVTPPSGSVTATVIYRAWISAADTVTVRAVTQAAGENPASGTFRATVIKF